MQNVVLNGLSSSCNQKKTTANVVSSKGKVTFPTNVPEQDRSGKLKGSSSKKTQFGDNVKPEIFLDKPSEKVTTSASSLNVDKRYKNAVSGTSGLNRQSSACYKKQRASPLRSISRKRQYVILLLKKIHGLCK